MCGLHAACLLSILTACSLEETLLVPVPAAPRQDAAPPPRDAGSDAGGRPADAGLDAAPPLDAAIDASQPPLDAAIDASQPPPDAAIDASQPPPDAAPGPLACDERYGSVDGYLPCPAAEDRCAFYGRLGGQSCDGVCQEHGGECVESLYDSGDSCTDEGAATCGEGHSDAICVCSRP